jgi:energy-coupling factor transport system ATP-binding protein
MNFMDSVVGLRAGGDQPYRFSAILFITHDVDLAVCYANRVLLMSEGRIVNDGPPQVVLSDFELMESSRVIPTSLLRANLEHFPQTGRFMRAEALAQAVN